MHTWDIESTLVYRWHGSENVFMSAVGLCFRVNDRRRKRVAFKFFQHFWCTIYRIKVAGKRTRWPYDLAFSCHHQASGCSKLAVDPSFLVLYFHPVLRLLFTALTDYFCKLWLCYCSHFMYVQVSCLFFYTPWRCLICHLPDDTEHISARCMTRVLQFSWAFRPAGQKCTATPIMR